MDIRKTTTDNLFKAILSLKTLDECYLFFEDVCTIKELTDIGNRFEAANMLNEKQSFALITQKTGMSAATISRVNRCLNYGDGGYRLAIDRTKGEQQND